MSRPDYDSTAEQVEDFYAEREDAVRVEAEWHKLQMELDIDEMIQLMVDEDARYWDYDDWAKDRWLNGETIWS